MLHTLMLQLLHQLLQLHLQSCLPAAGSGGLRVQLICRQQASKAATQLWPEATRILTMPEGDK